MKRINIIHIGKAQGTWYTLGNEYYKKIAHSWDITITSCKDADSSLPIEQRKKTETQKILNNIHKDSFVIELHPEGKTYSSIQFAKEIDAWSDNRTKILTFIIAGTFGFERSLLPQSRKIISLSALTFTHEMAFTLLLEQLYRAYTILHNIPYHH